MEAHVEVEDLQTITPEALAERLVLNGFERVGAWMGVEVYWTNGKIDAVQPRRMAYRDYGLRVGEVVAVIAKYEGICPCRVVESLLG